MTETYTTDEVRERFAQSLMLQSYYEGGADDIAKGCDEFDLWMATHDAVVKAEALREAAALFDADFAGVSLSLRARAGLIEMGKL